MPRYDDYDHEQFDRPRRHTRPRTKDRPTYDDAVDARVVTVDRGRYTCLVDDRQVTAMNGDVSRPLPEVPTRVQHAGAAPYGGGDRRAGDSHIGERTGSENEERPEHDVERVREPEDAHRDRGIAGASQGGIDHEQHEHTGAAAEHDARKPGACGQDVRPRSHDPQQVGREEGAQRA